MPTAVGAPNHSALKSIACGATNAHIGLSDFEGQVATQSHRDAFFNVAVAKVPLGRNFKVILS